MLSDLLRYSCQMALPGFGEQGQQLLKQARVLIAGAGGLGCPAALYLTSSGVGTIGIADDDTVSQSNLHRQILYTPEDVGLKKAVAACHKLHQQNPDIQLIAHDARITSVNVTELIERYDIVVDGTDNFETKYLLNDACCLAGKPLVYGAIYQYEGHAAVWNAANSDGTRTPNFRDLFPQAHASQIPDCAEGGVLPNVAGIIGCMQANEVIKYLTGTGTLLAGKLLIFDALTMQSRIIKTGTVTKTGITHLQPAIIIPLISPMELKKGIDEQRYKLIDVRSIGEREAYHIGGMHIPISELNDHLSYFDAEQPFVLYCASGRRSAEAIIIIRQHLPEVRALSLQGGIKAWREHVD